MSRRIWDTLSPEDRTIFHDAARASARYMKGAWQSLEEQARKGAAEAGVTIISDIDRKPFEDATKPLRDELRADPKLGSLILYPCGNAGMPRSMAFFHVPAPTTCGETCAR